MAAGTCRSRGWSSVAVAVQWIGGSRSPGDLHRNATREGVSQGAGQQKRSQRRARDRADDASRLIPARARQDACKPETKGAPRRSKDTPGKGSCDRERYPWFVAQFWAIIRNLTFGRRLLRWLRQAGAGLFLLLSLLFCSLTISAKGSG